MTSLSDAAPGVIVGRLSPDQQQHMVAHVRRLMQQAPIYTPRMPGGQPFRYQQTGAGWGWTSGYGGGYRYQREHPITGDLLPAIPEDLVAFVRIYGLVPDALLVNFYSPGATLGLHQDRDERDLSAPVVSVSLGDTATFLLGGQRRSDPVQQLELPSGTVMLLAGENRMAWHGVAAIHPGTAPAGLLRSPGRINLTFRRSQ